MELEIKKEDLNLSQEKENKQQDFLNTMLGKTINTAIDIGIRAVLPDLIEDQAINLKDNLLQYGLKEGIQKSVESALELGKSAIGIVTGDFSNIGEMQTAVEKGGIIDSVSSLMDITVDKIKEKGLINKDIAKLIKNGKDTILNNVENNIEKKFTEQINGVEKLQETMNKWNNSYQEKDFDKMNQQYKQMEKELEKLVPIEETLKKAREIENIHNLIKNNNKNFNLSNDQLELAKKL